MYDEMVKNAYEEICGIDKEAAFEGAKAWHRHNVARRAEDRAYKANTDAGHSTLRGKLQNEKRNAASDIVSSIYGGQSDKVKDKMTRRSKANTDALKRDIAARETLSDYSGKLKDARNAKSDYKRSQERAMSDYVADRAKRKSAYKDDAYKRQLDAANALESGIVDVANMKNTSKAELHKMKMDARNRAMGRSTDIANAISNRAHEYGYYANRAAHKDYDAKRDLGFANLAAKRVADKKAEKAAEKAAAYYDEAQYIKEAAEADYAEACAYEDAALQILDELGYLD